MHSSRVTLTGVTGSAYDFSVCEYHGAWNDIGGIYAFAFRAPQGFWVILYVGKADSYRDRMRDHEKWESAVRQGATHVLAFVNENSFSRDAQERDLIRAYQPTLNVHHVAPSFATADLASFLLGDNRRNKLGGL